MLRTYAVDPAVVRSPADLLLLRERFAATAGRLVARYPGKWERMIRDATSGWTDIEQARVAEVLVQLRRCTRKERGRDWDPGRDWLVNAEREHHARPFTAIVSHANPRTNPEVMVWEALTDTDESWCARPMVDIPRTAIALAETVAPLLRSGREWVFIDPNFDPTRPKWQRPLAEMLLRGLEGRDDPPGCIEYHMRSNGSDSEWFSRRCQKSLEPVIPAGISIMIRRWEELAGGPSLHDRHVITESLGVDCSFGLDEATQAGEQGHQRVYLLSEEAHGLDAARYRGTNPEFRLVDEFTVTGRRGMQTAFVMPVAETFVSLIGTIRETIERLEEHFGHPHGQLAPSMAEARKSDGEIRTEFETLLGSLRELQDLMREAATEIRPAVPGTSKADYRFYRDELFPVAGHLRRSGMVYTSVDLEEFFADVDRTAESTGSKHHRDRLERALSQWDENRQAFGLNAERQDTEEDTESAWRVLSARWFQPELWERNSHELAPSLLADPAATLPLSVMKRLRDIFQSFMFGNYMVAISLSRSVLEFAIRDRFGSESENDRINCLRSGVQEDPSLKTMLVQAAEQLACEVESINGVRKWGNQVMHPEFGDRVAESPLRRYVALRNLRELCAFLELLYR